MQKQPYFCPTIGSFWTKSRIIPLVSFTLLSNFSFLGSSLNAVKEKNIKGGSGGPKLKTKIEKNGGSMGGGHTLPGGDPPSYPQDGSKFRFFRKKTIEKIFNLTKKLVKRIFFQSCFAYCIFIVWDLF